MRVDKLKYKGIKDTWQCGNCGCLLPKSQGKMKHLSKCRDKESMK
jgi:hypothetical protein